MRYVFIVLLYSYCSLATCQTVVIDGTNVTIDENLITSINGNLTNKGNLRNNGEIRVTGSWMNLGSYESKSGKVIFTSDEDQVINHNSQNFENFTIAGGGRKILMESVTINGQVKFESGILLVEKGSQLTFGPAAILDGASEESYVVGEVYRQGTGDIFFPIGTDSEYLPVSLTNVTGTDPLIGIIIHGEQSELNLASSLRAISTKRFWELITDESYSGSNIVLPIVGEEILSHFEEATIAQATSLQSNFYDIGRATASGTVDKGSITSAGLALGKFYAIGKAPSGVVLPPIRVINVVTPMIDGKHDFLRIENIELYENNEVEIFNRLGELVFNIKNYDNQERVFKGIGNTGNKKELVTGNYLYSIKTSRNEIFTGYIYLKQ